MGFLWLGSVTWEPALSLQVRSLTVQKELIVGTRSAPPDQLPEGTAKRSALQADLHAATSLSELSPLLLQQCIVPAVVSSQRGTPGDSSAQQ